MVVQTSHELGKMKITRLENYLDAIKYLKNEGTIKKTFKKCIKQQIHPKSFSQIWIFELRDDDDLKPICSLRSVLSLYP